MGAWDEHLLLQTFLNEFALSSDNKIINSNVGIFLLGVAQHEIYDILVEERPIDITRIDFEGMEELKTELPSISYNIIGIGISLWKTFKKYKEDEDNDKLRKRLLGLVGAITPDILEAVRLFILKDGEKAWMRGDSQRFHISTEMEPIINTRDVNKADLKRRGMMEALSVSFELFSIQW